MNPPAGTAKYHWIITLTGQLNGEQAIVGDHGVCDMPANQSRHAACSQLVTALLADVMRRTGSPLMGHNIAYFDLQPDHISR